MRFPGAFLFDPKAVEKSGVVLEPNKKLKKYKRRHVRLRLLNTLFSIVVFGCLLARGHFEGKCLYNGSRACDYATTVGMMALAACVMCTLVDVVIHQDRRKAFIIFDGTFSIVFAGLYFFGFMYLGNQWMKSETPWNDYGVNHARTVIVFCALSVFAWSFQAYYTFRQLVVLTPATYETQSDDTSDKSDAPLPPHYYNYTYQDPKYDSAANYYPSSFDYETDKGFVFDSVNLEEKSNDPPPPYVPPPAYANVCGTVDQRGFI